MPPLPLSSAPARIAVLSLVLAALAQPLIGSAGATMPGRNGLLAYGDLFEPDGCEGGGCGELSYLTTLNPRTKARVRLTSCSRDSIFCGQLRPAWSPDGQRLAFDDETKAGFFVANADGSGARRVASDGSSPTWSSDGKRLAFTLEDPARDREELNVIKLDGTGIRRITARGASDPDWSSRNRIAFLRQRGSASDVLTIRPDGTERRFVRRGASSPSWSPDGRRLAVVLKSRRRLSIVVVDGRGKTLNVVRRGRQLSLPIWSPDGKSLAFVEAHRLKVLRLGSSRARTLTPYSNLAGLSWQAR